MYKVIRINGEDYKVEFSIEASLYNDCIEKITGLMFDVDAGQSTNNIKQALSGISDIPNTAVHCLYAGLLEHHGTESGDGKVPNLATAKRLAAALLKDENSEYSNWYDILTMCANQMGEDGFFELIGLTGLMTGEETTQKRGRKKKVVEVSET